MLYGQPCEPILKGARVVRDLRPHFWIETLLATITGVAFIATLVFPAWIEELLGVEPDAGSGIFEWAIVVLCAALTVSFSLLARREWSRARYAPP
jgi:hypothetical protein